MSGPDGGAAAPARDAAGPLAGLRIVDFSHVFQGPVATLLLADLGADVIKVERPRGGDWSRAWGPYLGGLSLPYAGLNRNKRSLAIDLGRPEGQEIVHRLLATADVLVHNFRPGAMRRLGLDFETLHARYPRLVYAQSSGWGDTGPSVERGRPGHDMLARAEGGWFVAPSPGEIPVPAGISADYPAGLMLAIAILAGIAGRARTGSGSLVSTDLLSVALHAHTWEATAVLNPDPAQATDGIATTELAIDKTFRTRDGLLAISPVFSDNSLRDISTALGLGDLSADPRFATRDGQLANRAALNELLGARIAERTTAEWMAELEPLGVLCAQVHTLASAAEAPQARANAMVVEVEHPRAGRLRTLGTPIRVDGATPQDYGSPSDLGADNAAILRELGYTDAAIEALAASGVLGPATPTVEAAR